MKPYFQLMRPDQWIKNAFVFAGFLFYGQWHNTALLCKSLWATLLFCLASSAVYAFNDAMDAERDRLHPSKKKRPVAMGSVSKSAAFGFSAALASLAVLGALFVNLMLCGFVAGYFWLNLAYTLRLKELVILDVFCIALGFLLRMLSGTVAIHIPPSHWIILCTLMVSLFLGFAKRSAELSDPSGATRPVLSVYSPALLHLFLGITTACTVMTYGLYTISERTIQVHGTAHLIYTLPLVVFGLFRYLHLVLSQGKGENPSKDILEDRQILVTLALYLLMVLALPHWKDL